MTESAPSHNELVTALHNLTMEVETLRLFECHMREAIGNENWLSLRHWTDHAKKVLEREREAKVS